MDAAEGVTRRKHKHKKDERRGDAAKSKQRRRDPGAKTEKRKKRTAKKGAEEEEERSGHSKRRARRKEDEEDSTETQQEELHGAKRARHKRKHSDASIERHRSKRRRRHEDIEEQQQQQQHGEEDAMDVDAEPAQCMAMDAEDSLASFVRCAGLATHARQHDDSERLHIVHRYDAQVSGLPAVNSQQRPHEPMTADARYVMPTMAQRQAAAEADREEARRTALMAPTGSVWSQLASELGCGKAHEERAAGASRLALYTSMMRDAKRAAEQTARTDAHHRWTAAEIPRLSVENVRLLLFAAEKPFRACCNGDACQGRQAADGCGVTCMEYLHPAEIEAVYKDCAAFDFPKARRPCYLCLLFSASVLLRLLGSDEDGDGGERGSRYGEILFGHLACVAGGYNVDAVFMMPALHGVYMRRYDRAEYVAAVARLRVPLPGGMTQWKQASCLIERSEVHFRKSSIDPVFYPLRLEAPITLLMATEPSTVESLLLRRYTDMPVAAGAVDVMLRATGLDAKHASVVRAEQMMATLAGDLDKQERGGQRRRNNHVVEVHEGYNHYPGRHKPPLHDITKRRVASMAAHNRAREIAAARTPVDALIAHYVHDADDVRLDNARLHTVALRAHLRLHLARPFSVLFAADINDTAAHIDLLLCLFGAVERLREPGSNEHVSVIRYPFYQLHSERVVDARTELRCRRVYHAFLLRVNVAYALTRGFMQPNGVVMPSRLSDELEHLHELSAAILHMDALDAHYRRTRRDADGSICSVAHDDAALARELSGPATAPPHRPGRDERFQAVQTRVMHRLSSRAVLRRLLKKNAAARIVCNARALFDVVPRRVLFGSFAACMAWLAAEARDEPGVLVARLRALASLVCGEASVAAWWWDPWQRRHSKEACAAAAIVLRVMAAYVLVAAFGGSDADARFAIPARPGGCRAPMAPCASDVSYHALAFAMTHAELALYMLASPPSATNDAALLCTQLMDRGANAYALYEPLDWRLRYTEGAQPSLGTHYGGIAALPQQALQGNAVLLPVWRAQPRAQTSRDFDDIHTSCIAVNRKAWVQSLGTSLCGGYRHCRRRAPFGAVLDVYALADVAVTTALRDVPSALALNVVRENLFVHMNYSPPGVPRDSAAAWSAFGAAARAAMDEVRALFYGAPSLHVAWPRRRWHKSAAAQERAEAAAVVDSLETMQRQLLPLPQLDLVAQCDALTPDEARNVVHHLQAHALLFVDRAKCAWLLGDSAHEDVVALRRSVQAQPEHDEIVASWLAAGGRVTAATRLALFVARLDAHEAVLCAEIVAAVARPPPPPPSPSPDAHTPGEHAAAVRRALKEHAIALRCTLNQRGVLQALRAAHQRDADDTRGLSDLCEWLALALSRRKLRAYVHALRSALAPHLLANRAHATQKQTATRQRASSTQSKPRAIYRQRVALCPYMLQRIAEVCAPRKNEGAVVASNSKAPAATSNKKKKKKSRAKAPGHEAAATSPQPPSQLHSSSALTTQPGAAEGSDGDGVADEGEETLLAAEPPPESYQDMVPPRRREDTLAVKDNLHLLRPVEAQQRALIDVFVLLVHAQQRTLEADVLVRDALLTPHAAYVVSQCVRAWEHDEQRGSEQRSSALWHLRTLLPYELESLYYLFLRLGQQDVYRLHPLPRRVMEAQTTAVARKYHLDATLGTPERPFVLPPSAGCLAYKPCCGIFSTSPSCARLPPGIETRGHEQIGHHSGRCSASDGWSSGINVCAIKQHRRQAQQKKQQHLLLQQQQQQQQLLQQQQLPPAERKLHHHGALPRAKDPSAWARELHAYAYQLPCAQTEVVMLDLVGSVCTTTATGQSYTVCTHCGTPALLDIELCDLNDPAHIVCGHCRPEERLARAAPYCDFCLQQKDGSRITGNKKRRAAMPSVVIIDDDPLTGTHAIKNASVCAECSKQIHALFPRGTMVSWNIAMFHITCDHHTTHALAPLWATCPLGDTGAANHAILSPLAPDGVYFAPLS